MQTPLFCLDGPTGTLVSASAARYSAFASSLTGGAWVSANTTVRTPISRSGTISKLRTRFVFSSPLTTGTYVLVLQVDGSDSLLTATINAGESVEQDLVNEVAVTAGQDLCWKVTGSGADQVPTIIQISCVFDGDEAGKSALFGILLTNTVDRVAQFGAATGDNSSADEANTRTPMPTSGQSDRLYVRLVTAPGTGITRTFTVMKNGVATAQVVTFSDAESGTKSVTANVTWAAGDTISLAQTITGGVPPTSASAFSMDWTPDIDGESLLFSTFPGTLSQAATRYANLNGRSANEATETSTYSLAPMDCTLRKLRANVATAPGAGKSWALKCRKGAADQLLAVTVADAATTAADTSNDVAITAADLLDWSVTPSGTPTASAGFGIGSVVYVVPAVASGGGGMMLLGVG